MELMKKDGFFAKKKKERKEGPAILLLRGREKEG